VELGGPAKSLAAADAAGALLGMVDDDDSEAVLPLQFTQPGEQRSNLARGVFVDAMQAHKRIEHKQARPQLGDCRVEARAICLEIEPQGGGGDHLNVEIGERDACGGANAFEPLAHDVERVLGGVEQDASGARHHEAAQAGGAGCDRDGDVEGKEGFAAFWLTADDSDRLFGPQRGDEPALRLGALSEAMGWLDRRRVIAAVPLRT
jgi:hypothetical protein